jgi:tetratricopeptide (TPR) repeat protein
MSRLFPDDRITPTKADLHNQMTRMLSPKRQQIVRQIFISLALVIATVMVYLPVRHNGFVNLDDNVFVTENPNIQSGLTWPSVRWAFTADLTRDDRNADYWRPVSYLSHELDVTLFGLRPAGHHLMNVGIHAAAAVALFLVLHSMTNAPWRCAFVAALFALHPLRVESVAWVTERKDVLSGLLFMLTLGAYVRHVRRPFSAPRYLAVLVLFALALMAKPMVVTLPFVLLLLDYWPLGRTRWAAAVVGQNATASLSQLLKEKIPFFALAVMSSAVTSWGQRKAGAMDLIKVPLGMRTANALISYVDYIGKMFWPTRLAVFYPLYQGLPSAAVLGAGIGLVGVTATVIWAARRSPWLVTGWFWYLGMLVPVIGLVQGAGEAMADRFAYIPLVGLFIMIIWSVPSRAMEPQVSRVIACVVAMALLAVFGALSKIQVGYWKDSETLFRHALDVTRDNWLAHCNLARASERAGRIEDAISHYGQAVKIRPEFPEAHVSLGVALWQVGRVQEAVEHFEQALRLKPDDAAAHNNLGLVLCQAGEVQKGIGHYEQALRIDPNYVEAEYNSGSALLQEGKFEDAISHYERVLRLKPDYAEAHAALGFAFGQLGKLEDAIRHYEQAVQIKPDYAVIYYNLGATFEQAGRIEDAIRQYRQALRIKPDFAEAQNRLAKLRAVP